MIKILVDSTCDIEAQEAVDLGLHVIPLTYTCDGVVYRDGIDQTREEFYTMLKQAERLPKTSMVNAGEFLDFFEEQVAPGEEAVCITISSALSGTFSAAVSAAELCQDRKIYVVDSQSATIGTSLLIRVAVKLRDEGNTASQVVAELQQLAKRIRLVAIVDTLKYLKMGGRLSAAAAAMGTMLGIVPILAVKDGRLEAIGKVRGKKAAFLAIKTFMEKHLPDSDYPVVLGHSRCSDRIEKLQQEVDDLVAGCDIKVQEIGTVIGTHVGPGALGCAYIAAQKKK